MHSPLQRSTPPTQDLFARRGWQVALASVGLFAATVSTLLLATALLAACETQPLYVSCQLDEDVKKKGLCNGDTSATRDTSSCVVKSHPQCDRSVCLSYYGTAPICTMTCTENLECGETAECWTYADEDPVTKAPAQRYCVPKATMIAGKK